MTYAPAPADNIIWSSGRFLAAAATHSGRGDPFAGGYSRHITKASDGLPWGFIVSAVVVLAAIVGLAVRL